MQNTGQREGKEVVQLFVSDSVASFTPDIKRLRGFEKISLKPGESKTVSFKLPLSQLAFVAPDLKQRLEEGEFKVQVGNQTAIFTVSSTKVF